MVNFDAVGEVEARLRQLAANVDPAKRDERARFMKTVMPLLGLTVPQQRQALKQGYSFSNLPFAGQLPVWDGVWRHAVLHEAKFQAVLFVNAAKPKPALDAVWPVTRRWAESLNCWDQSDELSKHYSGLLEASPEQIRPVLQAWNSDDNPWKRRQSLVSLFCYARLRRRFPAAATVLSMVEARLGDMDHYVQKGLGWTLRECFAAYPVETLAFLKRYAAVIRPTAFSTAIEKLSAGQKLEIKTLRQR